MLSNSYSSIPDNVKWNNNMQEWTETNDPFGIPVNRPADPLNTTSNQMAVGQYTEGSVVKYSENGVSGWPGNLGLAATFNPSYALLHGQVASQEYRALGIATALSPQVDLGWSEDSVVCMAKHYPGDGAAEGGREAHNNFGKYNVYPGNNLEEHVSVFDAIIHIEDSLTGGVKAFMPYLTEVERHLLAIESGLNMFGGSANVEANIDAYQMGVMSLKKYDGWHPALGIMENEEEDNAEETMHKLYEDSAYQCLLISFYSGLFDDPYISLAESEAVCGNSELQRHLLDASEELAWVEAGGEVGTSRSYSRKTTTGNTATLDMIKSVNESIGDVPLVACVEAIHSVLMSLRKM